MESVGPSTSESNVRMLLLHSGFFKSKFLSQLCRRGAISKKKMDDDYTQHKKFWKHIRKVDGPKKKNKNPNKLKSDDEE